MLATVVSGFGNCVQETVAESDVIFEETNELGFVHGGAGEQVTLATHPGLETEPSLLNWNVKHPSALEEVNGPGIVVPQYPPAGKPLLLVPLVLAIIGEPTVGPSKTYNGSQLASVLNETKVTVANCPAGGQILIISFALFV